jgi:hypothetical protein
MTIVTAIVTALFIIAVVLGIIGLKDCLFPRRAARRALARDIARNVTAHGARH